jgi:AcrR family transcriptional regulator
MKATPKLSGEERRAAIIQAVRRVFADKGFHGTTTRELARAAGVSEALLFKHFPDKEALFSAMKLSCCSGQALDRFHRLLAREPSALTLVLLVHFLAAYVVGRAAARDDEQIVLNRLMLRSLAEDGEFAEVLLRRFGSTWVPKFEQCIQAARATGDVVDGPVAPGLGGWLVHHLVIMVNASLLPPRPVVDYGLPWDRFIEQTVWFCLRGVGLKEEAIRRCYTPETVALCVD